MLAHTNTQTHAHTRTYLKVQLRRRLCTLYYTSILYLHLLALYLNLSYFNRITLLTTQLGRHAEKKVCK